MAILTFDENAKFHPDEWQQQMLACRVREVLLVHGTFAGDDPLGIIALFDPKIEMLASVLKIHQKKLADMLAKDLGNYTQQYADALGVVLNMACNRFTWSSGNYHLARIKGAIGLARTLAESIGKNNIQPDESILLLGHSHAGQLFALLTTFLENGVKANEIYAIMDKYDDLKKLRANLLCCLETIKTVNLDFVTFGTPVRYPWGKYAKARLLAVVNHRSRVQPSGLLATRDGDYVQQWGVEGSDFPPPDEGDASKNDAFDAVLDTGRSPALVKNSLEREEYRDPIHADGENVGETILVDYRDDAAHYQGSTTLPVFFMNILNHLDIFHCVRTLFGHGAYTRENAMPFNMNLVVGKLYPLKSQPAGSTELPAN